MQYWQKKIVALAVLLLLFSVVFVYAIFLKKINPWLFETPEEPQVAQLTGQSQDYIQYEDDWADFDSDFGPTEEVVSWSTESPDVTTWNSTILTWSEQAVVTWTIQSDPFLVQNPNMSVQDTTLPILSLLWVSYEKIYKGTGEAYYVELDYPISNVQTLVSMRWWSIASFTTPQEVSKNKLFWDRTIFINFPQFKDKTVHLITEDDELKKSWLVAIDYWTYFQYKWTLQNLLFKNE